MTKKQQKEKIEYWTSGKADIDKEIRYQAAWLANCFSTRCGYVSLEENLLKMGKFVKNRMLDIYNIKEEKE